MRLANLFGIGASHPASWPSTLSTAALIKRVKAFLRQDGWTIEEPLPWLRVFVRARKNGRWLQLIIHTSETLSLRTTMFDALKSIDNRPIAAGILTFEVIPKDIQAEARRSGLFVFNPAQFDQLESLLIDCLLVIRAKSKIEITTEHVGQLVDTGAAVD